MATLTPEQRREIQKAGNEPVVLEEPETRVKYVILSVGVYKRLQTLAEIDRSDRSLYEFGEFRPIQP
jgi:hypothetical protein